jgi:glycosyltransferase involved in cell wall biosynthesis
MNNKPLVSVCMITYGHEKFIQQSIESILMQQTTFDFELVIANDCSPDTTDAVVNDILKTPKKANKIKYFSHSKNKGMYANFLFALSECKLKYIALCEGDDYWIDPLKLQKQVDFLESNPDYEVCFTNISIINENNLIVKDKLIIDKRVGIYEQKDLPIWAPTLTRVFKNRDFTTLPNAPGLDRLMLLYQSKFGKIKFINEVTGVYRLHEGGIYSANTEAEKKEHIILTDIASLPLIDKSLYPKYFGILLKKLLELKSLDQAIYFKNKKRIQEQYKVRKTKFSCSMQIKIRLAFLLISLSIMSNTNKLQQFLMKVLNRFFIY